VGAAAIAGVGTFLLIFIVPNGFAILGRTLTWAFALNMAVIGLIAGAVVSCALAILWAVVVGDENWGLNRQMLQHTLERQRIELTLARSQLQGTEDTSPDLSSVEQTARIILDAHYKKTPTTREYCEARLGIKQADWNIVNKLMAELGWKKGHSFNPQGATFEETWALFLSRVKLNSREVWVISPSGRSQKKIA